MRKLGREFERKEGWDQAHRNGIGFAGGIYANLGSDGHWSWYSRYIGFHHGFMLGLDGQCRHFTLGCRRPFDESFKTTSGFMVLRFLLS
jgi:hypothetical protein